MAAIAVRYDAYRTLAFGSISGTYAAIGTPTAHLMRLVHFVNNTNANMNFSFDGTTDNVFIPANSFALYDLQTNSESGNDFFLALNTQIYVKQNAGAATSGSVYIIMVYGKGQ